MYIYIYIWVNPKHTGDSTGAEKAAGRAAARKMN